MINTENLENIQKGSLKDFIHICDENYQGSLVNIKLFDNDWTASWQQGMREKFVKIFYHLRGHFHDFLWILGNFAPDQERKQMILANIQEEFGGDRQSHEQLYIDFGQSLGVDLIQEMKAPQYQLDFVINFNRQHHQWLLARDWEQKQSAFSAYERLDNLDYPRLLSLAESLGVPERGLIFFKAHAQVTHFDVTESFLHKTWADNPKKVMDGFNFIYQHQLQMWHSLTMKMEAYESEAFSG